MPISPEQFKQILAKSSELCSEEAKNYTPSSNSSSLEYDEYNLRNSQPDLDYTSPYGDLDESYDGVPYNPQTAPQYSPSAVNTSRMPDAIKQSMMTETIDVSAANPNRSVLDSLMIDMPAKNKRANKVNEQFRGQSPQIDYSIIKAIIEECIDRKLNEFFKKNLNESSLKTIELSGGKIRLIDNKGNLFSADLKRRGNVNENK